MLAEIQFCLNHRSRIDRYARMKFSPGLNLVIGPNGSGKSTVLEAIHSCPECRRIEAGPTDYVLFNTESMNPHLGGMPDRSNLKLMALKSRAMFSSHGEIMQAAFSTLGITPQTCLLLDEPEAGQDLHHILLLRKSIHKAVQRGTQIICATHDMLLWSGGTVHELRRNYQKRAENAVATWFAKRT
jgi:predicted ATPase